MVRKLSALWLVVLIVMPFSAPFPTCDVTDLLSGRAPSHPVSPAPGHSIDDATTILVPPVAAEASRMKLAALSGLRGVSSVSPAIIIMRTGRGVDSASVIRAVQSRPQLQPALRI